MPVSRQTLSRFGPIHCGQSSARTELVSPTITARNIQRFMANSLLVGQDSQTAPNRLRRSMFNRVGQQRLTDGVIARIVLAVKTLKT